MGQHGLAPIRTGRDNPEEQARTMPSQDPPGDECLAKAWAGAAWPVGRDADDEAQPTSLSGIEVAIQVVGCVAVIASRLGPRRHPEREQGCQRVQRHGPNTDLGHEPPPSHNHQVD